MAWHAHSYSFQACGDNSGYTRATWQYQGQWSGPKSLSQLLYLLWQRGSQVKESPFIGNMDNQGIAQRTALGNENTLYGLYLQSIGSKTIDGFSGKNDQLPGADKGSRMFDFCYFWMNRINFNNFCMDMLHTTFNFRA